VYDTKIEEWQGGNQPENLDILTRQEWQARDACVTGNGKT
jgi:hypothetical protein